LPLGKSSRGTARKIPDHVAEKKKNSPQQVTTVFRVFYVLLVLVINNGVHSLQREFTAEIENLMSNRSIFETIVSISSGEEINLVRKSHKFEQRLILPKLRLELNGMRDLLMNMNPLEEYEFSSVQGTKEHFRVANILSNHGLGLLKCHEHNSALIDFPTFSFEKFKVNGTILLNNRVLNSGNSLKCVGDSNLSNKLGMDCVRTIFNWAIGSGLNLARTEKELYHKILASTEHGVLYLAVNQTHMFLEENPIGYVICKSNEMNNEFDTITKSKFFGHLSDIYYIRLNYFEQEMDKLESVLLALVHSNAIKIWHEDDKSFGSICSYVKKYSFTHCVSTGNQMTNLWHTYFNVNKPRFVEIDNFLNVAIQHAVKFCDSNNKAEYDYIFRVFESLMSLMHRLQTLRSTYETRIHDSNLRLLVRDRTSSTEMRNCLLQYSSTELSVIDTMILAAKIYNSKLSFCAQFCTVANISSYEAFKTHDLHFGTKRSKRWFFSYSLSQMTGLAESSVVKTLSDNTKKVI
jgi:hypothetical protein